MKIALVIKSLSLTGGGAERFSRNLIRGLLARGHKISAFCFDWDEGTEALDISLHKIPKLSKYKHPWFDFSEKVHKEIKKTDDYDVIFGLTQLCPQDIHRLGGGIYRYWYELKYGKFLPLQMLRGRVRNALKFEKSMYSPGNYRQLITISEMDRKILMKYYNVPPEKVHTIYNGFDFEEFNSKGRENDRAELCTELNISSKKTIILFAANNYKRKGLPQAVESILKTNSPEKFALIVIGRGRATIKRKLSGKAKGKVEIIWLDHVKNPAHYYRGSDIFLFPTLYDSFANVIGEALACGLPVITTGRAGGAEFVINGANGFVVENANATDEMSKCLNKFTDKDLCNEFSKNAPEIVSKYTIEHCAEKMEKILLSCSSLSSH